MFRFFVITFEILVLVLILRSPFVQFWLSDVQASIADWMLDMSLIVDNQQLASFRQEIALRTQNLSEYQLKYLRQITDNKARLKDFNRLYCQGHDKNPYLYGASLRYLCDEIGRKGILRKYS
jgi:hypothetical protein